MNRIGKSLAAFLSAALLFGSAPQVFAQSVSIAQTAATPPSVSAAVGTSLQQPVVLPSGLSLLDASGRSAVQLQPAQQDQLLPLETVITAPGNVSLKKNLQQPDVRTKQIHAQAAATPAMRTAPLTNANPVTKVLRTITKALRAKNTSALFHGGRSYGLGILHSEQPAEIAGVRLDAKPSTPKGGNLIRRVSIPRQASGLSGTFDADSSDTLILPGAPQEVTDILKALREAIAADPNRFGGISPDSLFTTLARRTPGVAGLEDTVYVNFQQTLNDIPVEGSLLSFTLKTMNGQTVVVHTSARLYPDLKLDTQGKLDENALEQKALARLGNQPDAASDLQDQGMRIMQLGEQWRVVSLRRSQSLPLIVAVDINTGETFAWNPRIQARIPISWDDGKVPTPKKPAAPEPAPQPEDPSLPAKIMGRGTAAGPFVEGAPLSILPLGHIQIKTSDGQAAYADADGVFTVPGTGSGPVQITLTMTGRYARIMDRSVKTLTMTGTVKPGDTLRAVFNPSGAQETSVAQVNAYYHVTRVHDWLKAHGITHANMDKALPVNTDIDDECNAGYDPYNPSLHLFRASPDCANTAFDNVIYHEYGHFTDAMIHHGIPDPGLSEGWGDTFTMYILNSPEIGRGFFKKHPNHILRDGENTYKFGRYDEEHDQGQAFMGFSWKLRKAFIAAMGEAQGAALASALILPVIFSGAQDIPDAIEAVLMRDIGQDGTAQHFQQIAAAAKIHGFTLLEPGRTNTNSLVIVDRDSEPRPEPSPWDWGDDWYSGSPWGFLRKSALRILGAVKGLVSAPSAQR
ncbi:MAG: hypothetical protein WCU88_04855 [Elusimicrobiota bacterium]|jgi:hypothetical protein